MSLVVPSSFPDRPLRPYNATVDASGNATIEITPLGTYRWSVKQVSAGVEDAPAGATCTMRHNGSFVTRIVPTGGVASGEPPAPVWPGDRLTLEWTGCTPGQVATALVFYDEVST